MAQKKIIQTAGRTQLGEFAPEFARLNDDILFGEVWSRKMFGEYMAYLNEKPVLLVCDNTVFVKNFRKQSRL